MPGRRWGGRLAGDRGAVAPSVVVVPVLMTVLLTVVQVALWFYGRALATSAAQHGLDAARVAEGSAADGEATIAAFVEQTGGLALTEVDVDRGADTVTVTVEGEVVQVVPFIDVPVRVTVQGSVERVAE